MGRPEAKPPSSVSEIARLAQAFEEYRPRLLAMVQRRIDPALAARVAPEDIVGDAFLRARARWSTPNPAALPTYAWLYRNALDCLIEAWRSANAAGRSIRRDVPWPESSSVQLGLGLVGSLTTPSTALRRKELRERIHWAMSQLKPDDQEILAMRHFDELSHKEAAAILNVSEHAATVRYARALARLRQIWKQIEPDAETTS
jgi:RNA polymerase sigma-70 factor (ECF subfamily)